MPNTHPLLPAWANVARPVIGMLHAPPLPGSPRFGGDVAAVVAHVLRDAGRWPPAASMA